MTEREMALIRAIAERAQEFRNTRLETDGDYAHPLERRRIAEYYLLRAIHVWEADLEYTGRENPETLWPIGVQKLRGDCVAHLSWNENGVTGCRYEKV